MTIDKAIYYIKNSGIDTVNSINQCNEFQLKKWKNDLNDEIARLMECNKHIPINYIAEQYLINHRIGKN